MFRIDTRGKRFFDEAHRERIFSGINMVFKGEPGSQESSRNNYIPSWKEEDIRKLRDCGFNVVRLGLIWDGVEPEPGKYDEKYLDWIEKILNYCKEYELYAYLDMHQDLFSCLYSDGAPQWATITDGMPHVKCELWSDSYLLSDAVKRAFDNFWLNAPAFDGIGVQDHYANMWCHVAERFSSHPAVIGFDFLNEPYPGSSGFDIFGTLIGAFTEISNNLTNEKHTIEEMMDVFSDEQKKFKALKLLEEKEVYKAMASASEPLVREFDRGVLASFYKKMRDALRKVTNKGIIFIENCYFSNLGIECQSTPIIGDNGEHEPLQAFSPHGYDLVVDTDAVIYASNKRVDVIFGSHKNAQQRMNLPVLVGEWGAHGNNREGLEHVRHLIDIFEENLWSNTYWCYTDGFDKLPVLNVLKRGYPQAVAGELINYHFDMLTGSFEMSWVEDPGIKEPTIVYLPYLPEGKNIQCQGEYYIRKVSPDSDSCYLYIKSEAPGKRFLKVGCKNDKRKSPGIQKF